MVTTYAVRGGERIYGKVILSATNAYASVGMGEVSEQVRSRYFISVLPAGVQLSGLTPYTAEGCI